MDKMKSEAIVFLVFVLGFLFFPDIVFSAAEEAVVIPKLGNAPKIDGTLDNPIWEEQALKIEDFLQFAPREKGMPTQKTVA